MSGKAKVIENIWQEKAKKANANTRQSGLQMTVAKSSIQRTRCECVGIGVAGAARRSNRAQTAAIHALASHKLRQPITATRSATIITNVIPPGLKARQTPMTKSR